MFMCIAILAAMGIFAAIHAKSLRNQAIERGYALHCPADGEWAWKGEC